jgi:hypothetical protein
VTHSARNPHAPAEKTRTTATENPDGNRSVADRLATKPSGWTKTHQKHAQAIEPGQSRAECAELRRRDRVDLPARQRLMSPSALGGCVLGRQRSSDRRCSPRRRGRPPSASLRSAFSRRATCTMRRQEGVAAAREDDHRTRCRALDRQYIQRAIAQFAAFKMGIKTLDATKAQFSSSEDPAARA